MTTKSQPEAIKVAGDNIDNIKEGPIQIFAILAWRHT